MQESHPCRRDELAWSAGAQARWGRRLCVWQPDMGCQSSWDIIESTGRAWGLKILWLYSAWASLVAQMVKNVPAMRETWIQSLGQDDPLQEGMATHSSILAWSIPMDRGAWWATVHGIAKSQTWWATKHSTAYIYIRYWYNNFVFATRLRHCSIYSQ